MYVNLFINGSFSFGNEVHWELFTTITITYNNLILRKQDIRTLR